MSEQKRVEHSHKYHEPKLSLENKCTCWFCISPDPFFGDSLVVKKRGGGERVLTPKQYYIDTRTPHGEAADWYEKKPYGGKRYIDPEHVVAILRNYSEYHKHKLNPV